MMKVFFIFVFSLITISVLFAQDTLLYKNLELALKSPNEVYKLELKRFKGNKFPMEILQFKNLVSLNLSKNGLRELPEEIGQLTNLRYLNVSKNNLKRLPNSIGQLINLEQLIAHQNNIEALPESIGNLKKLNFLDLWSNELGDFPATITQCENLKIIDMRGILLPESKQEEMRQKVPQAKIYFTPGCNCGH